jgi:hypothetical protein
MRPPEVEMVFRVARSVAVVSAVFAISLCVYAAEPAPRVCPPIDAPALAQPAVRVFIDPATGKRRAPTAAELRQIAEERLRTRRAKVSTLVVETHAGGMKSVDLGDAFLMEVVLEKGLDGVTRTRCLPGSGQRPASGSAPAGEK